MFFKKAVAIRHVVIAMVLFFTTAMLQYLFPHVAPRDKVSYSFNEGFTSLDPESVEAITIGYPRLLSSMLWLRFLQNTPPRKVEPGHASWIYHDLLNISVLDPDFRPIYVDAAIFLSVVTEDKLGAEKIFLRGIERFPLDWQIRFFLAYHYEWELKEPRKAFEQYRAAASLPGAPDLVRLLAAKYSIEQGQNKFAAVQLIESFVQITQDPKVKERLKDKLRKIPGYERKHR